MQFLIGSIILNTLLTVIFRYYSVYKINNFFAIVVNYLTCFAIGAIMTKGRVFDVATFQVEWFPFVLFLGTIFILTFNVVAMTVQSFGMTIATLMQKMSVLIVVVFSILYYNEVLNLMQDIGLVLGCISIFLITGRPKVTRNVQRSALVMSFPLIIFILGGIIDSTFVHLQKTNLASGREDAFATYLFGLAGVMGAAYLLWQYSFSGKRYQWRDVWAGIALGIPNFFTVYFIQKMLTVNIDGSVIFPIHNIGILVLSAVVSKLLFDEKFTLLKLIGVTLASVAIILLATGA